MPFFSQSTTQTFNYTGSPENWIVPPSNTSINYTVAGAEGGVQMEVMGSSYSVLAVLPDKQYNLQLEVKELVPVQVIMGEELVLVHRFQQIHHVEVEELAILGCLLFN